MQVQNGRLHYTQTALEGSLSNKYLFLKTVLQAALEQKNVKQKILTGRQSEMIDRTILWIRIEQNSHPVPLFISSTPLAI